MTPCRWLSYRENFPRRGEPVNAVLFASEAAITTAFAGLALVERALIVLARAGVQRCALVGPQALPRHDARFPAEVLPLPAGCDVETLLKETGEDDLVLCTSAEIVCQPSLFRRLTALRKPAVVVDPVDGRLPLAALRPRQVAGSQDAFPATLGSLVDRGEISEHRLLEREVAAVVRQPAQIPELERHLLRSLDNPRDGRVDALLNRRLSRPISLRLLRTRLRPNHITVVSFLVALLGAAAFSTGSHALAIAGALLFQLSAVLDCCDGEIARMKLQESEIGDALDISLDAIGNAALFAGIARGVWANGRLAAASALGWTTVLGILGCFAVVTYVERALPEPGQTPQHRIAQRLVAALTTRDFSVIVFAAALVNALPAFLWGAAVGANVFWVLLLTLVVKGRA